MSKVPNDFDPFLSKRWLEHKQTIGGRARQGLAKTAMYPRMSPGVGMRMDSWPKTGGHPGSDLPMMQEQLSGPVRCRLQIARPIRRRGGWRAKRRVWRGNGDRGQRVADWRIGATPTLGCWAQSRSILSYIEFGYCRNREARGRPPLRPVNIPPSRAGTPGAGAPGIGRSWQACAANGFPVSLHLGGTSGHASTGGESPSLYHEEHPSYVQTMQTLVTSLVCEGVFEQIPNLKIVLVEGGFAPLPSLCWRLDKHWKRLKAEVPHLTRSPSEYVHERFWLTDHSRSRSRSGRRTCCPYWSGSGRST